MQPQQIYDFVKFPWFLVWVMLFPSAPIPWRSSWKMCHCINCIHLQPPMFGSALVGPPGTGRWKGKIPWVAEVTVDINNPPPPPQSDQDLGKRQSREPSNPVTPHAGSVPSSPTRFEGDTAKRSRSRRLFLEGNHSLEARKNRSKYALKD